MDTTDTALGVALNVIRDLVDPEPCWFDHNNSCQEHGYFFVEPGEKCPHAAAKELLAERRKIK